MKKYIFVIALLFSFSCEAQRVDFPCIDEPNIYTGVNAPFCADNLTWFDSTAGVCNIWEIKECINGLWTVTGYYDDAGDTEDELPPLNILGIGQSNTGGGGGGFCNTSNSPAYAIANDTINTGDVIWSSPNYGNIIATEDVIISEANSKITTYNSVSGKREIVDIRDEIYGHGYKNYPANDPLLNQHIYANSFINTFAKKLCQQTGRRVNIISSQWGGQTIQWWSLGINGWNTLLADLAANPQVQQIDYILWHQGEANPIPDAAAATAYRNELDNLKALLYGLPQVSANTPWVIGEPADTRNPDIHPVLMQFAQDNVNVGLVQSGELETCEGTHFTQKATYIMGCNYLEVANQLPDALGSNPTHQLTH